MGGFKPQPSLLMLRHPFAGQALGRRTAPFVYTRLAAHIGYQKRFKLAKLLVRQLEKNVNQIPQTKKSFLGPESKSLVRISG